MVGMELKMIGVGGDEADDSSPDNRLSGAEEDEDDERTALNIDSRTGPSTSCRALRLLPFATLLLFCVALLALFPAAVEHSQHVPIADCRGNCPLLSDEKIIEGVLGSNRTTILARTALYSFVHISKCAGAAWIKLLQSVLGDANVYPQRPQGVEKSVLVQRINEPTANYTLISVRSPRRHVWSMYGECRYSPWSPAKWIFDDSTSPDDGFDRWLSRFVAPVNNGSTTRYRIRHNLKDFGCYHPSNFQSRFLTSRAFRAQSMDPRVGFEPDPGMATKNLRSLLHFVAVQDFFHESKCLLFYRLSKDNSAASSNIRQYLEDTCRCPVPESLIKDLDKKVTHHKQFSNVTTMVDLRHETLEMVSTLTRSDEVVFTNAVMDFMREIVWLEEELGRRVMCDATLKEAEPELRYLGWSVTELYYRTKAAGLG